MLSEKWLIRRSMVVAMGMVLLLFVGLGMNAWAATVYVSASFDNYPAVPSISAPAAEIGGNWGMYNANLANGDYAVGEAVYGKANRSLKLVSTTNGTTMYTARTLSTSISGKVVMDAAVYFGDTTHNRSIFEIKNSGSTYVKVIVFDPTGKIKVNNVDVGTYTPNTWYAVRAILDNTSQKLDVFLNNQAIVTGASLPSNWDKLTYIKFSQTGVTGAVGTMYLDDVKITDYVPVSSVTLSGANQVSAGASTPLTAKILPTDATDQRLQWASSNPAVAAVDANGSVTGVSDGQAAVTVSTIDGGKTASTNITVASVIHVQSLSLPSSITANQGESVTLNVYVQPSNATDPRVNWTSSNSAVATVDANGSVFGVSVGEVQISATSVDGGKTASATVSITEVHHSLQSLGLPLTVNMEENDTITLQPYYVPHNASNRNVSWATDHADIADVDSTGKVTSYKPGTVLITATAQDGGKTASTTVTVVRTNASIWDEYDRMRAKWKKTLDGGPDFNATDPDVVLKISAISSSGSQQWSSMITAPDRTYLWSDLPPSADTSDYITNSTARLKTMALAYSTKGSVLYHNIALRDDIVQAMDWLYFHYYNEQGSAYGNWWNWEIGTPLKLADLVTLMYDALTPQQISNYMKAVDHYIGNISPTFRHVGANRSDVLTAEMIFGIATKDFKRLGDVRDQMSPLFQYVTSGDGIYDDGSFIQHNAVPYTGSYGEVLIRGVGNLMYMLNGSTWQVNDPNKANVFNWVTDAFEPIIYKGQVMDLVRGRAIARANQSGYDASVGMFSGIIRISQFAPPEIAVRYKRMIKQWISANPAYNYYAGLTDIEQIQAFKQLMADPSIPSVGDSPTHYELNGMARSVHRGNEYAFGISKSSKRVQNYELTNGENGEGWYTGDGMTYLYNADLGQYAGDYWPTVNRYRLPGITVDNKVRTFTNFQNGDGEGLPTNTWAGGSVYSTYGISGMNLRPVGSKLNANKSWFMFDDEIVALGSGISDSDNLKVETIVEQRKLNASGNNALTVDGTTKSTAMGWSETVPNVGWAHLTGNVPNSDIGYYFPDTPEIHMLREQRTGKWSDINMSDSTPVNPRTNYFLSMGLDHGINPHNKSYSYVLLPNKNAAETGSYASHPDITILANTEEVHAVRENKLQLTGMNFWKDERMTVDKVTSSRAASVLIKESSDHHRVDIAVSDPTLENSGVIELEINQSAAEIIWNDQQVFITQLYPTIKLTVNVKDSLGKTFNASFDVDPSKPRPEAGNTLPIPTNIPEPMPIIPPITHVYDLFDEEVAGNLPAPWTANIKPHTTASVQELGSGNNGKSLRLIDYNNNEAVSVERPFTAQTGKFEMEWKFAVGHAEDTVSFEVKNVTSPPMLKLVAGGTLGWMDTAGQLHAIKSLQPALWYKVKLRIDPVRHQYDVYVDNELVAANALFMNPGATADIFRVSTGITDASSVVYLDDVVVYVYGAKTLINDTFDTNSTDEDPQGWTVGKKAVSAPVSVVEEPSAHNKSVMLGDNDSAFSSTMYKSFDAQSGKFTAEWSFKETNSGKFSIFELLSGSKSIIKLNSNGTLKLIGPGNVSSDIVKMPVRLWHTIRLNIDAAQNRFDIYMDGEQVQTGAPFWNAADTVNGIKFSTGYGAIDATMYIDNVKVYTYESLTDQVTVTPAQVQLVPGETIALAAQVTPVNSANGSIVWESSNNEIASVNADGLVKALSAGTVHIISRTADNSERAESVITVTLPSPTGLVKLSQTESTVNLQWNVVELPIPALTYVVLKDGVEWKEMTVLSAYQVTNPLTVNQVTYTARVDGLSPSTTYTFAVKSRDGSGHESRQSESITVSTGDQPVTEQVSSEKNIVSFSVEGQKGASIIDTTAHTVSFLMPSGTDMTRLRPMVTVSPYASVNPTNAAISDFSQPFMYTVVAQDGTAIQWTVSASMEALPSKGHSSASPAGNTQVSWDDNMIVIADGEKKLNATVKMDAAKNEVRISAESIHTWASQNIERFVISKDDVSLSFEMKTLLTMLSAMDSNGQPNAEIVVKINMLMPAETDSILKRTNAVTPNNARGIRTVAGEMYQFEMAAVIEGAEQIISTFDQPVIVTLPYRAGPNEDLLGVYYFNEAVESWEYVGGVIHVDQKQIQTELSHFSTYTMMEYNLSFPDMTPDHWAYGAVKIAAAKHLVDGMDDGRFAPSDTTSRSQFAAMITRDLHLKASGQMYFDDVPQHAWYAQAVAAAVEAGLISGRTNQIFAPDEPITREEMAAILVRAAGEKGQNGISSESEFVDEKQISEWALPSVRTVVQIGVMNGFPGGLFHPTEPTTRAETVKALVNFMQHRVNTK